MQRISLCNEINGNRLRKQRFTCILYFAYKYHQNGNIFNSLSFLHIRKKTECVELSLFKNIAKPNLIWSFTWN